MRMSATAVLALASSAVLAGCSGSGSAPIGQPSGSGSTQSFTRQASFEPRSAIVPRSMWPPAHPHAFQRRPGAGSGYIVNSQANYGVVDFYKIGKGNQPVAGSLTAPGGFNFPQGVASDRAGNIYVANTGDFNVLVYAPGSSSPTTTLADPGQEPVDAVVRHDGTIFVANIVNNLGDPGSISVYAPGTTTPATTLTDSNFVDVIGVALDKHDNLYVSYYNRQDESTGSGSIAYYPKNSSTAVETGISIDYPGGVGVDKAGNILVTNGSTGILYVYAPGNTSPTTQFTLPGAASFFTFSKSGKALYTADYVNSTLDVFAYTPTSLVQTDAISSGIYQFGNPLGIALTPGNLP